MLFADGTELRLEAWRLMQCCRAVPENEERGGITTEVEFGFSKCYRRDWAQHPSRGGRRRAGPGEWGNTIGG